MASFADQFQHVDPFDFEPGGLLDGWPRQIVWEARLLLEGRTAAEVSEIARAVESVIAGQAERNVMRGLRPDDETGRLASAAPHPFRIEPLTVADVRGDERDLNLYLDAGGISAVHSGPVQLQPAITEWEAFGALAMWKLVDYAEALKKGRGPPQDVEELFRFKKPGEELKATQQRFWDMQSAHWSLQHASSLAIEAALASSLGASARRRHLVMAAVSADSDRLAASLDVIERAEQARVQRARDAARRALRSRWAAVGDHKQKALNLAASQPFRFRSEAARFAMERLEKNSDGDTYTFETVDRWLREAGWESSS